MKYAKSPLKHYHVSIDARYLQRRIFMACPDGFFVQAIHQNGTVACARVSAPPRSEERQQSMPSNVSEPAQVRNGVLPYQNHSKSIVLLQASVSVLNASLWGLKREQRILNDKVQDELLHKSADLMLLRQILDENVDDLRTRTSIIVQNVSSLQNFDAVLMNGLKELGENVTKMMLSVISIQHSLDTLENTSIALESTQSVQHENIASNARQLESIEAELLQVQLKSTLLTAQISSINYTSLETGRNMMQLMQSRIQQTIENMTAADVHLQFQINSSLALATSILNDVSLMRSEVQIIHKDVAAVQETTDATVNSIAQLDADIISLRTSVFYQINTIKRNYVTQSDIDNSFDILQVQLAAFEVSTNGTLYQLKTAFNNHAQNVSLSLINVNAEAADMKNHLLLLNASQMLNRKEQLDALHLVKRNATMERQIMEGQLERRIGSAFHACKANVIRVGEKADNETARLTREIESTRAQLAHDANVLATVQNNFTLQHINALRSILSKSEHKLLVNISSTAEFAQRNLVHANDSIQMQLNALQIHTNDLVLESRNSAQF